MPPDIFDRMEMVCLKPGMRIDSFDCFGKALGVIREGSRHLEAEVFASLQKSPSILTIFRRRFMGHEDAVMLILDDHHTGIRTQWVVAINVTFHRRGERQQVPQHLLWRGQMPANVINPAFHRRLGNGYQEQYGKEEGKVPETDPAHDRKVTGQPDHTMAHMLRGRDALDGRCEVHALVLVVQVGTLRHDEPILDRIVKRRQFMNLDRVGLLAPTDRRGRFQRTLKVQFAQIELDNRCAIFDKGADKGILVELRDNRLKLHLYGYSHPCPFAPTDVPLDMLRKG